MLVKLELENLGKAEEYAKQILEHVEAIKRLQNEASYNHAGLIVNIKGEEATSDN